MACECIEKVNAHLADHNTRLSIIGFGIKDDGGVVTRLIIGTEKVEPRKKGPRIVSATFCPFCGVSFNAPTTPPAAVGGQGDKP